MLEGRFIGFSGILQGLIGAFMNCSWFLGFAKELTGTKGQ